MSRLRWWVMERHNPQLGVYYVGCGQMTAALAKQKESPLYGFNVMHPFGSERTYRARLEELVRIGETVQGNG